MSVMTFARYQRDEPGNCQDCDWNADSYCFNQLLGTRCDPYGIVDMLKLENIGADPNLK